ncbi:hypothetical protein OG873_02505 [Streptomyces violaceus]|uniref:Uncharacterized protein n=1 Tax=Streptomyces violaceus TaxID=1936 RepID=A0ABZ1P4A0_STRVL
MQLNTELARMPVDNTSGKWSVGGDDNVASADATSITPWRSREEHRPIGEIQRVRQGAYRRSSIERHRINGQQRREPVSSAHLLG